MPIDDRTTNLSYKLPAFGNFLADDVVRLRDALAAIDADIYARYTKVEVDQLISDLIQGAPGALDTLNELAAAMGDDPNFAATVTNQLALKANAADVYDKAESDARYVQGAVQTEMSFVATANQSVFALSTAVINKASALVTVNGIVQPTAEYSLNQSGTELTLSEGVSEGTNVRVLAMGVASPGAPADDSVTTSKLRDAAVTTPKLASGIEPTVASINGGPLAGFRNAIINGNFDIWQRATSHSTQGYGSADRWQLGRSGTTCTISRQAFTLGQTDVPGEPTYFCRAVVSSVAGASNYALLSQNIEGVRTFAGRTVTVSFWAKADTAKSIAIELNQYFGTGGSPSDHATGLAVSKVALGTAWQKVTMTATLPSISGKTLGTNNNDWLGLVIWFDGGSTFNSRNQDLGQQSGTFDIARVQVEPGEIATPFEQRPLGTELELCQRYGQWVAYNMLFTSTANNDTMECPVSWRPMRATPNVAGLTPDPNTPHSNLNNSANYIWRATPYGASAYLQAQLQGTSWYVGYRSWLSAEL